MKRISFETKEVSLGRQVAQVSLLALSDYSPVHTAVRLIVKAIECTGVVKPCGLCASCLRDPWLPFSEVNHFDTEEGLGKEAVLLIKEASQSSGSDQGRARVFVIGGVEQMSVQAANTLLKFLEDTPVGTFFILTTRQITKVLPTIISRASVFAVAADHDSFKQEVASFCKNRTELELLLNACCDASQAKRLMASDSYGMFKEALLTMSAYKAGRASRMSAINALKGLNYPELALCRRYLFNAFRLPADRAARMANLERRPIKVVVADELVSALEVA